MHHNFFKALPEFLTRKHRQSYPGASSEDIEDAVGTAVESYLTTAPQHVRACEQRSRAWLFTTAWRMLRRERLRSKRHLGITETLPSSQQIDISATHLTESLKERTREIVHLHSFDGMKPREIASVLGCSVNAVNMHLKRAYRELRDSLKQDYAVLRESYYFWLSSFKAGYAVESAMIELSITTVLPI